MQNETTIRVGPSKDILGMIGTAGLCWLAWVVLCKIGMFLLMAATFIWFFFFAA